LQTRQSAMALTFGVLGAGMMAEALCKGLAEANEVQYPDMSAYDPNPARQELFAGLGCTVCATIAEVVTRSKVILISVKPDTVAKVLTDVRPQLTKEHLLISIAAGVTLASLEEAAGGIPRVVRVMPNTPCLVRQSASGLSLGATATGADGELVKRLFDSVGVCHVVDEKLLDAVTGLSGSGPAYVFQVIEALSDGGVAAGLPRPVATSLAAQTVAGAAQMVLQTGTHPGALKDQVTSPGGTTIAGVHELERGGLRAALMNAVTAAAKRATELGQKK